MTNPFRLGLALALGLTLSACGTEKNPVVEAVKALPSTFLKKSDGEATGGVTEDQMTSLLAATPAPVEFFHFESRKAQFMMLEIERNGPYQSYGSPDRRGIVLRSGMITATRGFGGDLMSVEEDALLRLVQSRQAGSASYQQRFLTPEDVTETRTYTCDVTPGARQPVTAGEINGSGIIMTALCRGEGVKFTNTYIVDNAGSIITGRQWIGFPIGYVGNQALRR
ncbi:YjbF family lipoprotein [Tropicibacter oceani]|uniref:YjbF family lipoprotein n=1 Tax=Tropicibacter oceani TaxID=3058420 RepID=A0ABY8QJA7_9RHOB|nr:YjbF family lipoprotein [Tropicibacter oceani]WGW04629.1 YjbF family lipoprotein [Tropicibacter oceani]